MDIHQIEKFSFSNVLVIGDYMVDQYISGDVERISPEAPIPVVKTDGFRSQLGGAGNVINNIQSLKGNSRILTYFGKDSSGDYLLELLKNTGSDTSFIRQYEGIETVRKIRVTARGQQIVRVDFEKTTRLNNNDFEKYVAENIDAITKSVDVVVISDYGKGVVTQELMKIVIPAAKQKGIPVIIDPKGKDWTKYSGATMCTPNLSEFSDVVNKKIEQSMETTILSEGVEVCKKYNLDYVLVTRSEYGMSLISKNGSKKDFPVKKKLDVIDVSGAGDTVISSMALSISSGKSIEDGCEIANIAASIAVSKFGTSPISYEELYDLMTEKKQPTIVKIDEIRSISEILHSLNKKIVFTNGCFDILHAGHVHSLECAKSFGDILVIGLNSDKSVKKLKGDSRPIISENDRAYLLKSLRVVDYVVIFDDDTPKKLIEAIKPDILVKGEDYLGKEVVGQDIVDLMAVKSNWLT